MSTDYIRHTLLGLDDDGQLDESDFDPVDDRIMLRGQPALLHERMRILRDDWILVGELTWPGEEWHWLRFAYVAKDSPHRVELMNALQAIAKTPRIIE